MPEAYFGVPYFRELTSLKGWNKEDRLGTNYHVVRAFFRLNLRQLAGSASIGRKFDVQGHAEGMTTERIKIIEIETEALQQVETIERSIVESECMTKVLSQLTASFGDGKIFKAGGRVSSELSSRIKCTFADEFKITNSSRKRQLIKYSELI